MNVSRTEEVERISLCASSTIESPIDFPDSGIGLYLIKENQSMMTVSVKLYEKV